MVDGNDFIFHDFRQTTIPAHYKPISAFIRDM